MKAVGYRRALPIDNPASLIDVELPEPQLQARDVLVEVSAVSVNPVDTKVRQSLNPEAGATKVLGWDAAGVVRAVGAEVTLFRPGDNVWYAGSIARPGTNSELHVVDERIVGKMPQSLSYEQAAALPLTTITAWELLFDRLEISRNPHSQGKSLLVIGAAGGVGSILVQLARKLTGVQVIASAARPESIEWVRARGAHEVIDHRKPITEELGRIGVPAVNYVASLTHTADHFPQIVDALAPQGKLAVIDDPAVSLDTNLLKPKSASLHWEFMFTRSLFATPDMIAQYELLNEVAGLVDQGVLVSTVTENYGTINAANLRRAHAQIESGTAVGKIVLAGF